VETEFVTRAIRNRRLAPTDPAREAWPWRLQLRVLGGLQVLRDGQPLSLGPKRPKKPLELLALLAAQGGRPLSHDAAIDTLWPDTEADAPKA
jgi:DNA-binding SARP family transcriptional activator